MERNTFLVLIFGYILPKNQSLGSRFPMFSFAGFYCTFFFVHINTVMKLVMACGGGVGGLVAIASLF